MQVKVKNKLMKLIPEYIVYKKHSWKRILEA